MPVPLILIAIVCVAAAVFFYNKAAKLSDTIDSAQSEAESAKAEARKNGERAEQLRKKYESVRDTTADHEKAAKDARKKASDMKAELQKFRTESEGASKKLKSLERQARRSEQEVAELRSMIDARGIIAKAAPKPEPEAVVVEHAPVEVAPANDSRALRMAELAEKKEERRLEFERLQNERETLRNSRLAVEEREELEKLRGSSQALYDQVFARERELRVAHRKLEHNRQAYIVTAKQLDLVEDELYRVIHGKERPESDMPLPTPEELVIKLATADAAKAPKKPATKPKKVAAPTETSAAPTAAVAQADSEPQIAAKADDDEAKQSEGAADNRQAVADQTKKVAVAAKPAKAAATIADSVDADGEKTTKVRRRRRVTSDSGSGAVN